MASATCVTSSKHTLFVYTFLHSFIHLKTVTQMDSFKYKQTYISSAAITHLIRIYWSPYIIMKVLWGADYSNKSCTAGIAPRTIIKKGLPGQWTRSLPKWCLTSSHHRFNIETFLCCAHFFLTSLLLCKNSSSLQFFHLSLLSLPVILIVLQFLCI